jgi:hypothetical protein
MRGTNLLVCGLVQISIAFHSLSASARLYTSHKNE